MSKSKIYTGNKYWMLKLTMTWVWDYSVTKHLFLPRMWKIQHVEIGDMFEVKQNNYSRNDAKIFVYDILTAKNKLNTLERVEINHPVGDFEHEEQKRYNLKYNHLKRFNFFNTKKEAESKLLSLRHDIEKYAKMQVERYREATMKKIDKMNKTLAKLDQLDKTLAK